MRKWLIGVILALGVVIGSFAQDTAPFELVATLDAEPVRALAISSDGGHLIVATGDGNEAQVYNLEDPSSPEFVNAAQLDGTPTAVIGAQDFALVTVAADDADLLQIVARPPYNPRQGFINYGTYDIIGAPTGMAISPSNRWGIIYGENGFTALEILSVDEINSATVEDVGVTSAAVSNTGLLLLPADNDIVHQFTMERGAQLGSSRQLELSAAGLDIALNIRGTVGAVLLEDDTVLLFDPARLGELGSFALPDEFSQVNFLTREESEWLVLSNIDGDSLLVLDVTDPSSIEQVGTFDLSAPLQALTVYNNLLIVSDGQSVSIFAAE
jgi:hypothetical protein